LYRLKVEELMQINDFYNAATRITITYVTGQTVLMELYEDGDTEEFILSKRDLILVQRNFYVEDVCDIVYQGVYGFIEVKINESEEHYPVQISVKDGHKYYCNIEELNYINKIIENQKARVK